MQAKQREMIRKQAESAITEMKRVHGNSVDDEIVWQHDDDIVIKTSHTQPCLIGYYEEYGFKLESIRPITGITSIGTQGLYIELRLQYHKIVDN